MNISQRTICVFAIIAGFACNTIHAQIDNVFKVGQPGVATNKGLVFYSLPQSVVAVKVVAEKKTVACGPYFEFAEELLGIKGVSAENKIEWKIDSIEIYSIEEPDLDAIYALQVSKGFQPEPLLKLSKAGLICNVQGFNGLDKVSAFSDSVLGLQMLNEYSIYNFTSESFDTLYKTILKDTTFVKIPILRPKTTVKNLRDRAKEAADIIYKIRQRRFELLMSEDEAFSEVNVLKYALAELRKIESSYMEQFVGKEVTKQYSSIFYYTPLAKVEHSKQELFWFSRDKGFVEKSDSASIPFFVSINNSLRLKGLQDWVSSIPTEGKNMLYYRLPEPAYVKIDINGKIIASKRLLISQFGAIIPYSVK